MTGKALPLLLMLFAAAGSGGGVFTVTSDHASTSETEGGETLLTLRGNVVVTDDQVTVTSDSARVFQTSERAEFFSGVHVEADTLNADGAYLTYSRITGVMVLAGGARLSDGSSTLTADRVDWFRFRDMATAREECSSPATGWVRSVVNTHCMTGSGEAFSLPSNRF